MPWPIPSPKTLAERLAGVAESAIMAVRPAIDPVALSRAVRSARGMLAILLRSVAMEIRAIHDHVAWWGRQYFVDTAEAEFVARHGSIWGVDPRPATAALGEVVVEGEAGTVLPALLELATADGVILRTTAAATIGGGGSVTVAVAALRPGPDGNVEAGARLVTVVPFPEILRVTVAAPGLDGGAADESPASHAGRIMARIRQAPHGGAGFDYPAWLAAVFPVRAVRPVTDWIGRGSVGVIVAMSDEAGAPRAPSEPELDAMLDYLGPPGSQTGVRPVTAHVVVLAAELEPIDITVRLRPDTAATRAAVTDAFARFVATIGDEEDEVNAWPIGATIEPSRISEAISAASGEYAHDLILPAARYELPVKGLPVAGAITFEDPL